MAGPSDRFLVALSGGADSVGLLGVLLEIRDRGAWPWGRLELAVGHVNHGLREEALDDEAFCEALSRALALPYASTRIDVTGKTRREGLSIEDAARSLRYRALGSLARRLGCQRVALGHTEDDQAETFLLRLLRGAGTKGLASAYPVVEARFVRPLLEIGRAELRAWVAEKELPFREDESNRDQRFSRNRLRRKVMPHLVNEFNPALVSTLASSAALLRDEEDYLDSVALEEWKRIRREEEGNGKTLDLSASALRELHVALQRRVVRLSLGHLRGDLRGIHRRHVESVLSLLGPSKSGRELHLPGVRVARSFDRLELKPAPQARDGRPGVETGYNGLEFEYHLTIPGRLRVFECGGTLVATRDHDDAPHGFGCRESTPAGSGRGSSESESESEEAVASYAYTDSRASGNSVVVADPGHSEIYVRSPRASDRFRPLGAPGSKRLSRYLMERKIARQERPRVPLVVSRNERTHEGGKGEDVLWVVGHAVSETARIRSGSRRIRLAWTAAEAEPL
jgi:tRNA(Ile)-lysidine synthase